LPSHAPDPASAAPAVATPGTEDAPAVDGSVGVGGYRATRMDPLDRATGAVLELLVAHGVHAARVEGSSWEELALARAMRARRADSGLAVPLLVGGGPVLVDAPPRSEREYWAHDAGAVDAAIASAVAHDVGWISVAFADPDRAAEAAGRAHAAGLRVSHRGSAGALEALRPGDHLPDLAGILADPAPDGSRPSPLAVLLRWAHEPELGAARLEAARRLGLSVGSGLVALRRSVFVRESLDAPFLEELAPILPHTSHIREMKRPGGYLVGKRHLREDAGLTEPGREDAATAERGWAELLSATGAAADLVVPASRAPQLTSVPGYAWHEECALLAHAGVDAPARRGGLLLVAPARTAG